MQSVSVQMKCVLPNPGRFVTIAAGRYMDTSNRFTQGLKVDDVDKSSVTTPCGDFPGPASRVSSLGFVVGFVTRRRPTISGAPNQPKTMEFEMMGILCDSRTGKIFHCCGARYSEPHVSVMNRRRREEGRFHQSLPAQKLPASRRRIVVPGVGKYLGRLAAAVAI